MKFYQRVAVVFGVFSLSALVGNLLTAENEDYLLNTFEMIGLVGLFTLTLFLSAFVAEVLQVTGLFVASGIAAFTGDLGPATVLGTVAIILGYAYGKFQKLSEVFITLVGVVQGSLAVTAALCSHKSLGEAIIVAILWAIFPLVGVWLMWSLLKEFAEDLIKQNRELLEINKSLMSGGYNGYRA